MQWALENLNQDDDAVSRLFALQVVEQFAKTPPKFLDKQNIDLATRVHRKVIKEWKKKQAQQKKNVEKSGTDTDN